MDNNENKGLNTSKLTAFFKDKRTVTALCAITIVIVLVLGYNIEVKKATTPVRIPVAKSTIQPKTKITADMLTVVNIPSGALQGNYIENDQNIIGWYSNVNTVIPAGSIFYKEAIVQKEDLPDSALYEVPADHTLYYLTVNMLTSFTNSILPGNYIDIYLSTKENGQAVVGRLIKDVKILAVKTSDGKNVFENSGESRVPYVIIFAVPNDIHKLLRQVDAINSYTIDGSSKINIIPVPTNSYLGGTTQEIFATITSEDLKTIIARYSRDISDGTQVVAPDQSESDSEGGEDTNTNTTTE